MFGVFFLQLWDFTFKKLKVEAKDRNIIMSAAGHIREKMAQIMFEKFECPGVFIHQPAARIEAPDQTACAIFPYWKEKPLLCNLQAEQEPSFLP